MNGEEELNHMKRTLPSHHLTYEAKGLQPHFEYQFWVSASTKTGEGQSSKVATQILSATRSTRVYYIIILELGQLGISEYVLLRVATCANCTA